ncbi:YIP1 family protein [Candidatus Micrarchaeota archaeon]|nr:YIP1 family protein [Candidatus Micrarchaeota archaeon]MBU1166520.1 YIP1 family protein [Candidatus Micrarchaeota archaeon]MBU1887532.1 YIP1 family protein [Candidatus Micrarchaeota archaeon]
MIDNKKVELFFRNRKKEASVLRAVLVFALVSFAMGLLVLFSDYNQKLDIILNPQLQSSVIGSIVYNFFIMALLLFIPAILLNWGVGKAMYKSKASFVEVTYVGLVAFSSFFIVILILNLLAMIYTPLAYLGLLLFIPFFYLLLVATKEVHNTSYGNVIVLLVITNLGIGVIQLGMFFVYAYFLVNSPVHYENNVTNNSDGTITATFAYVHTETGIPRDICYVTLPDGWKVADNETRAIISSKVNNTVNTKASFYKNDNEFLFFDGLPSRYSFKTCEKDEGADYWLKRGFTPDYNTYEKEYTKIDKEALEICDTKILNNNETITRHIVRGDFIGNPLGFIIIYQSPAEEDEDLYFIINNIRCYNNY